MSCEVARTTYSLDFVIRHLYTCDTDVLFTDNKIVASFNVYHPDDRKVIYEKLVKTIKAKYQARNFSLSYIDDESEKVLIDTPLAFEECLMMARKAVNNTVTLVVTVPKHVTFGGQSSVIKGLVGSGEMLKPTSHSSGHKHRSKVGSRSCTKPVLFSKATETSSEAPQWFQKYGDELKRDVVQAIKCTMVSNADALPTPLVLTPVIEQQETVSAVAVAPDSGNPVTPVQGCSGNEAPVMVDAMPNANDQQTSSFLCEVCHGPIDGPYFRCMHPVCNSLTFCCSCERANLHDISHVVVRKPGNGVEPSKESNAYDEFLKKKTEQYIAKMEKKLKKYAEKNVKCKEKRSRKLHDRGQKTVTVNPPNELNNERARYNAELVRHGNFMERENQAICGTLITKTWIVKNTGTVEWTAADLTAKVFALSKQHSAGNIIKPLRIKLPTKPGEYTDVSLDFDVPMEPATFLIGAQLRTRDGCLFGPFLQCHFKSELPLMVICTEPNNNNNVTDVLEDNEALKTTPQTPNNTPFGTTPAPSHPQSPRCLSPNSLQPILENTATSGSSDRSAEDTNLANGVCDALLLSVEQVEINGGSDMKDSEDDEKNEQNSDGENDDNDDEDSFCHCSVTSEVSSLQELLDGRKDIEGMEMPIEEMFCESSETLKPDEPEREHEDYVLIRSEEVREGVPLLTETLRPEPVKPAPVNDRQQVSTDLYDAEGLVEEYESLLGSSSAEGDYCVIESESYAHLDENGDSRTPSMSASTPSVENLPASPFSVLHPNIVSLLDKSVVEDKPTVDVLTPNVVTNASITTQASHSDAANPTTECGYEPEAVFTTEQELVNAVEPPMQSALTPAVSTAEFLSTAPNNSISATLETAKCVLQTAAVGVRSLLGALDSLTAVSFAPSSQFQNETSKEKLPQQLPGHVTQQIDSAMQRELSALGRHITQQSTASVSSAAPSRVLSVVNPPRATITEEAKNDALWKLFEMGFCNLELNRRLLQEYENDVTQVVLALIETNGESTGLNLD